MPDDLQVVGRRLVPPHQDQPSLNRLREVPREFQPDAAKRARDEINALGPQSGRRRLRGQRSRLIVLDPAVRAAIGDRRIAGRRLKFGSKLIEQHFAPPRTTGRIDIDTTAPNIAELPRDHTARAQQSGLGRFNIRFAGDTVHLV